MKTSVTAFVAIMLLCACGNGANENKGTETAPAVTNDTAHTDTMMQPNGVSNGTVTTDTLHK